MRLGLLKLFAYLLFRTTPEPDTETRPLSSDIETTQAGPSIPVARLWSPAAPPELVITKNAKISIPHDSKLTDEQKELIIKTVNNLPDTLKEELQEHNVVIYVHNTVPAEVAKKSLEDNGVIPAAQANMSTLEINLYLENLEDPEFLTTAIWHEFGHITHAAIMNCYYSVEVPYRCDPKTFPPCHFIEEADKIHKKCLDRYLRDVLCLDSKQIHQFKCNQEVTDRPDIPKPNTDKRKQLHYQLSIEEVLAEALPLYQRDNGLLPSDRYLRMNIMQHFQELYAFYRNTITDDPRILAYVRAFNKQKPQWEKLCREKFEQSNLKGLMKERDVDIKTKDKIKDEVAALKRTIIQDSKDPIFHYLVDKNTDLLITSAIKENKFVLKRQCALGFFERRLKSGSLEIKHDSNLNPDYFKAKAEDINTELGKFTLVVNKNFNDLTELIPNLDVLVSCHKAMIDTYQELTNAQDMTVKSNDEKLNAKNKRAYIFHRLIYIFADASKKHRFGLDAVDMFNAMSKLQEEGDSPEIAIALAKQFGVFDFEIEDIKNDYEQGINPHLNDICTYTFKF